MKKAITILSLILCISINAYAMDLSDWAEESFNNMSSYGILTTDIVGENMKENITREEFCSLLMNIYKCDKRVVLSEDDKAVFEDTTSDSVFEAYKVGIVSGKGDKIFEPESPITRQEIAVMLSRTLNLISHEYNKYDGQVDKFKNSFGDSNLTADWAICDTAAICDYNIITGNDIGEVQPLNNATREQAICMLDRVYNKFIKNTTIHTLPKFKSIDKTGIYDGKVSLSWQAVSGALEYNIIIKTLNLSKAITLPSNTISINEIYEELANSQEYSIILGVTKAHGIEVFSKPIKIGKKIAVQPSETPQKPAIPEINEDPVTEPEIENTEEPEIKEPTYDASMIHSTDSSALADKEKRVFPDGVYFESAEVAKEYMTEVEVPVWKLHSDGTKTSSIAYIEVNKALAEDVIKIFTEIYNDPSQFPIKNTGGYYWRNTAFGRVSQHSYGTCIDINWEENYFVNPDGTPITGTHWLPGEDPYSIAEDSIVVKTFAKYGWLWGGNAWSANNAKDYMHFTYLGK